MMETIGKRSITIAVTALAVLLICAVGQAERTVLPAELAVMAVDDLERFFRENVPPPVDGKTSVAIAPLSDSTGIFEKERFSFRTEVLNRLAGYNSLRLLPSSRFDVLVATMFPGRHLDSLTEEQIGEFAREAPTQFIVFSRISKDDDDGVRLEVRISNAEGGRMLYSPDYSIKGSEITVDGLVRRPAVSETSKEENEAALQKAVPVVINTVSPVVEDVEEEIEVELEAEEHVEFAESPPPAPVADIEVSIREEATVEFAPGDYEENVAVESGGGDAELDGTVSAIPESGGEEKEIDSTVTPEPAVAGAEAGTESEIEVSAGVAGAVEYISGVETDFPVIDLSVITIGGGKPGLVALTTGSMEVYKFVARDRLERVWSGNFKEKYPRRGLAGALRTGRHGASTLLFVSMNPFEKAFAYEWKDNSLERAGRISGFVVDVFQNGSVNLLSEYGSGVISFAGDKTRLIDTTGSEPRTIEFELPVDYYSACVLRWSDISPNLVQVAVASEDGVIRVYQGSGNLKAEAVPGYGGAVVCLPDSKHGKLMLTTTASAMDDAVVVLELTDEGIIERNRTMGIGGAVVSLAPCDLDGDGIVEVIGALEKYPSGGTLIFRLLPDYESVDSDGSEEDTE